MHGTYHQQDVQMTGSSCCFLPVSAQISGSAITELSTPSETLVINTCMILLGKHAGSSPVLAGSGPVPASYGMFTGKSFLVMSVPPHSLYSWDPSVSVPWPNSALIVQKSGLKHRSSIHPSVSPTIVSVCLLV